jgi:hypothetical protein
MKFYEKKTFSMSFFINHLKEIEPDIFVDVVIKIHKLFFANQACRNINLTLSQETL